MVPLGKTDRARRITCPFCPIRFARVMVFLDPSCPYSEFITKLHLTGCGKIKFFLDTKNPFDSHVLLLFLHLPFFRNLIIAIYDGVILIPKSDPFCPCNCSRCGQDGSNKGKTDHAISLQWSILDAFFSFLTLSINKNYA